MVATAASMTSIITCVRIKILRPLCMQLSEKAANAGRVAKEVIDSHEPYAAERHHLAMSGSRMSEQWSQWSQVNPQGLVQGPEHPLHPLTPSVTDHSYPLTARQPTRGWQERSRLPHGDEIDSQLSQTQRHSGSWRSRETTPRRIRHPDSLNDGGYSGHVLHHQVLG